MPIVYVTHKISNSNIKKKKSVFFVRMILETQGIIL